MLEQLRRRKTLSEKHISKCIRRFSLLVVYWSEVLPRGELTKFLDTSHVHLRKKGPKVRSMNALFSEILAFNCVHQRENLAILLKQLMRGY